MPSEDDEIEGLLRTGPNYVPSDDANREILRQRADAGRAEATAKSAAEFYESVGDTVKADEARAEARRLREIWKELDSKYSGPRP